jgi:hypothetical protein
MAEHTDITEWVKDPKSIAGLVIAIFGGLKAIRYRRKTVNTPTAEQVAQTAENDRVARLELRVQSQQRLLMQTREELNEVSLTLEMVSGRVQRLELSDREDRRQVKDALLGINERVSELVRQLEASSLEDQTPQ